MAIEFTQQSCTNGATVYISLRGDICITGSCAPWQPRVHNKSGKQHRAQGNAMVGQREASKCRVLLLAGEEQEDKTNNTLCVVL